MGLVSEAARGWSEMGMSRWKTALPKDIVRVLPTQSKSGQCGVSLTTLSTLACSRRESVRQTCFPPWCLCLGFGEAAPGGGVLLSGARGGHLPLASWPSCWGDQRAQILPSEQAGCCYFQCGAETASRGLPFSRASEACPPFLGTLAPSSAFSFRN